MQTRECEPRELFGPRVMAPVAGESPRIEEGKHVWNFQCCESWPKEFRVSYACADADRREYESPLGVWNPPHDTVCPRAPTGETPEEGPYCVEKDEERDRIEHFDEWGFGREWDPPDPGRVEQDGLV